MKTKRGTQKQASLIFGITERSVNKIWAIYKQGGKRALKRKKRGLKSGIKLKKNQAYKIRQMIKAKLPEQCKTEKGIIYFGGETGCRSDHQAGKSYAPKGQTPIIKSTGRRFTVNMISAISNRGHLQFMLMESGFNSEVFLTFLKQLIKYSKRKIFFITDNHPTHKTKKLYQWLEENKDTIEVFFIPPYSPELNPQEYLNQDLKTNIVGKKSAIKKEQLKENISQFINKRKADKPQVKNYFQYKHAKYVA